MRKFILIDHSISGTGGHYLEYAVNVLREAEKSCETYLVTNRLYRGENVPHARKTFAIYLYDIWGRVPQREKKREKLAERIKDLRAQIEKKVLFTSVCYFILGFKSGCFFMSERLADRIVVVLEVLVLALLAAPFVLVYLVIKLLVCLFAWLFSLCDKALPLPAGLSLKQLFSKLFQTLRTSMHGDRSVTKAFYRATRKTLQKIKLHDGDVIFIPTLSLHDTRAVAQILRDVPAAQACQWVLLYRRNLYEGRDPGYRAQMTDRLEWRKVFAAFMEYTNVRFLTDTEQLTDQYQTLGVVPFETAPIPMNPDFQAGRREAPGQFQIVYAGDARAEKGYPLFPDLAEQFALEGNTRNVRFRLQSNFAFREVRDDPATVLARNHLETMDSPAVELIKVPIPSEEYLNLVNSASVMPLLYHRDNYYARSSGALAEALASGIPVVVPSASWLALQVMPSVVTDQLKLQQQAERLPIKAESAVGWHSYADVVAAQTARPKKKKERLASGEVETSLINWDVLKAGLEKKKKKVFSENRLPVLGTRIKPTNFYQIPEGARAIFLRFCLEDSCGKGVFVRSTAKFFNRFGWEISRDEMEHSRLEELNGICTAIFRLPEEAAYVRLELSCPYHDSFAACVDFLVEFWGNSDFALGGIGCIYVETEQIYPCLTEIQRHLGAYWERAQRNAVVWNQFHSAEHLVQMLLERRREEMP